MHLHRASLIRACSFHKTRQNEPFLDVLLFFEKQRLANTRAHLPSLGAGAWERGDTETHTYTRKNTHKAANTKQNKPSCKHEGCELLMTSSISSFCLIQF